MKEPKALKLAVLELIKPFINEDINYVAGMEARGFIFWLISCSRIGRWLYSIT